MTRKSIATANRIAERPRVRATLTQISRSLTTDAALSEDLVQEAVIRAFLSLKSYRRSAPFTAWLAKIALNASHDYHRSAWNRRVLLAERTPEQEDNACPSGEVERREMMRKVRDSVSRLPEKMRTPIWLHYFEDFSIAEVADLERTSESTIRARLKAGMSRLFVVLNDYVGSGAESAVRHLEARECKI